MQNLKTIIAVALLGLTTLIGQAQTPFPSPTPTIVGTWRDTSLSTVQRVTLANSSLASNSPREVASAANFMLAARPLTALLGIRPGLADAVLADPTLNGTIYSDQTFVYSAAVLWKADALPALSDRLVYMQNQLTSASLTNRYAGWSVARAREQQKAGDYVGAIATALPIISWDITPMVSPLDAIQVVFECKLSSTSSDITPWAKLAYYSKPFQFSQVGVNDMEAAIKASSSISLDGSTLFTDFQMNGVGSNPLDGIPFPVGISFPGIDPASRALQAVITGNDTHDAKVQALGIVYQAWKESGAIAGTLDAEAATDLICQWLRNLDGNLIRANACAKVMTAGGTYDIIELK